MVDAKDTSALDFELRDRDQRAAGCLSCQWSWKQPPPQKLKWLGRTVRSMQCQRSSDLGLCWELQGWGSVLLWKKNWMGLSQASERPSELSALFFQGLLASFQLLLGLRSFGFSWLSCTVSVSVTVCKCFPLVLTISPSYHQSLELGPTLNISIHSHEPYTPYEALFLNNNHILRV